MNTFKEKLATSIYDFTGECPSPDIAECEGFPKEIMQLIGDDCWGEAKERKNTMAEDGSYPTTEEWFNRAFYKRIDECGGSV